MDFLSLLNWPVLFLASVVTAFIVSALNLSVNKVPSKILVLVIAFFVTLLVTTFDLPEKFDTWVDVFSFVQKLALQMIITLTFAVTFFHWGGEWLIGRIFAWFKKIVGEKFPEDEPPNPPLQPQG